MWNIVAIPDFYSIVSHLITGLYSMHARPDRAPLVAVLRSSAAVAAIVNYRRPAHRPSVDATPAISARRVKCALSPDGQSIRFPAPQIAKFVIDNFITLFQGK